VIPPEPCTSVVLRSTNELFLRWVQLDVSVWKTVHSHSVDRWALSGADVQAPYSVLEIMWLLCDEAQQVGRLRRFESCPLV